MYSLHLLKKILKINLFYFLKKYPLVYWMNLVSLHISRKKMMIALITPNCECDIKTHMFGIYFFEHLSITFLMRPLLFAPSCLEIKTRPRRKQVLQSESREAKVLSIDILVRYLFTLTLLILISFILVSAHLLTRSLFCYVFCPPSLLLLLSIAPCRISVSSFVVLFVAVTPTVLI